MTPLAWAGCLLLAVLCRHYRRQRDAARANARRVWAECAAGLARVGRTVEKIETDFGRTR